MTSPTKHPDETRPAADPLAFLTTLELPVVSRPGFTSDLLDPTPHQRRTAYNAAELAAAALEAAPARPASVLVDCAGHLRGKGKQHLRATVLHQACLLLTHLPAGARVADTHLDELIRRLPQAARTQVQADTHPRFAVLDDAGRLWFMQSHPGHWLGATEDAWTRQQIATCTAIGRNSHLIGVEFAGVVTVMPRLLKASAHSIDLNRQHALGACGQCLPLGRPTRGRS